MTGVWLNEAGTLGTVIAFSIGGLAIALIGLTYSELASAMPRAGGEHIYTQRALDQLVFCMHLGAAVFLFERVSFRGSRTTYRGELSAARHSFRHVVECVGSDVDLGFVLIGAGAAACDLGQLFGHSHRCDCANGSHRTHSVCGFIAVCRRGIQR